MKYIQSFKQHRYPKINEGWLADKMNEWDNDIKDIMVSFVTPFQDLIKSIDNWKTVTDPTKVKVDIQDVMDKSFKSLEKSIDKVEKSETLIRLYDDIDQLIVQLNDVFNKELDSIKESVESTAYGIKMVISGLLDAFKEKFKEFKSDYLDRLLEKESIDDKRQEAKSFYKEIYDKVKTEMKGVDVDSLMTKGEGAVKGDEEVNKDLNLKADDRVRYNKKNDEENIAIVANNQEDVDDQEKMVKLRTEDGNESFIIQKNQIIEVISDGEDSPEVTKKNILSKVDKIENDKDKLSKVNDFINKMEEN